MLRGTISPKRRKLEPKSSNNLIKACMEIITPLKKTKMPLMRLTNFGCICGHVGEKLVSYHKSFKN